MKVKSMKCPSCDASLKIKPGQTEGVCEYCKTPYVIDDEVIRIEKKTTIELKLDHDFEIAMATLENFKEYGKSEQLFRRLVRRYGHKKEVYLGLVRSITHDFNRQITDPITIMEVNSFWGKYKSLATKKEVSVYDESVRELNKKYWRAELIEITANFDSKKCKGNIVEIEKTWESYKHYGDEKDVKELEIKYNDFIKKEKNELSQKNRLFKLGLLILIAIVLVFFGTDFIAQITQKPKQKTDELLVSTVYENCDSFTECQNTKFIEEAFKDTSATITVEKVVIDKESKTLKATVNLKNRYTNKEFEYSYNLKDDMGPFISSNKCTYKDTDTFDVNSCFEVYDFTDGNVSNNNIEVDKENINFQEAGNKDITVRATDSQGNTSSRTVTIVIEKTKMSLKLSMDDPNGLVVGKSQTLNYSFEPANIPNQEVEITYDEKYVSVKNNVITGRKKGTTSVCVVSKYDDTKECIDVTIGLECTNTVIFNLEGGREETFVAGENFCSGKYKVYASVLTRDKIYTLGLQTKDYSYEGITIAKNSEFLTEEGDTFVFSEGTKLTSDIGVTQIKLVKVS